MRARSGMTLMELVVGLVITGVMAAMGTAAFGSIMDHQRVIRSSTVEMERAAALRETLRQWISSGNVATPGGRGPAGSGLRMSSVTSASGAVVSSATAIGDELTFTTSAPNPSMSPGVRIRLFIDGDESTPESGLTIEYQNSTLTPLQRKQLDPTIGSLTVEFLDVRTHRWYAASQASGLSVSAVRISLGAAGGYTIQPILELPLVFNIGGGAQ